MSIDIAVVVLSYDRVHLLERTLKALFASPARATYELVVVDNHPDQLARDLVEGLARTAPAPVTYLADARRNVSIVRNLGIKAAKGRYVAFVDDDEAPQPGWVDALADCLDRTGADACFGPKRPEFESGHPPEWDPQGWRYTLDFQMAADEPIHMFGRLRKKGKGLGSGNSAYRAATCMDRAEPFDVSYGDANGEDTQFLFRLALEGRSFVWTPDAVVVEFIETDRTKPDYMITRMKRGSQHYAASRIGTSDSKAWTRVKVSFLGLAQFMVHLGLFVTSGEFARRDRIDNRIGMAKGLGKLTWRAPIGFIDEKAV